MPDMDSKDLAAAIQLDPIEIQEMQRILLDGVELKIEPVRSPPKEGRNDYFLYLPLRLSERLVPGQHELIVERGKHLRPVRMTFEMPVGVDRDKLLLIQASWHDRHFSFKGDLWDPLMNTCADFFGGCAVCLGANWSSP